MKITIDIDCTAQEARSFLGLPDVAPMQEALMEEIQQRMRKALQASEPETLLKTWLPASLQGWEELQKNFWNQMAAAATGGGGKGGKSGKSGE
ncbi:DUF6489 family protein [Aquibaculum arenosum]|uniref:DUF6489 family protein n=1 Tax=Aquibaculum arenosum TaxID=3032591 RepID=A0ABT5YKX8_9PROT|nr:DUF6489 family protein [Fodinicurvata sp. CAU 1616]MDF2095584.1 DUF6489 family protein [Fodinicurvata sp. CAU 1616]